MSGEGVSKMETKPESMGNSLVSRAKALIMNPKEEWPRIAADEMTSREVLVGYIIPLAIIGPIAGLIGGQLFGYGAFGITFRPSLLSGIILAIVGFALTLINILILWLVADFLSPKFGGEMNTLKAFKLVAYAATAALLVGIFAVLPALAFLSLLGLYSVYLFYAGATPMLGIPQEKRLAFTAVVMICAIVLQMVVASVSSINMNMLRGMGLMGDDAMSMTVTVRN
jgi:hypothetical protein